LFQQGVAETQPRFIIVIVFSEHLAIEFFGALKVAGAQSFLGAVASLLIIRRMRQDDGG
jgi:hypothetical protein